MNDLFIPKENGMGWQLNFHRPLAWVIFIAVICLTWWLTSKPLKEMFYYLKALIRLKKD